MKKEENKIEDYYFTSIEETAKGFGVSTKTVKKWLDKKELSACEFIDMYMIHNKKSGVKSQHNTLMTRHFITIKEASQIFSVSINKIRLLIRLGKIASVKVNGIVMVVHYKIK